MATVDGVATNSEVRRQVLGQINHFKKVLRGNNPYNFTPASLIRNKTPWMSKFEEKFNYVVEALVDIESDPDTSQESINDVNRMKEIMTCLYEDFIRTFEAKLDTVHAAQPAPQPAAGLSPGLQAPDPMTNVVSPAYSAASSASEQPLAKGAQNLNTNTVEGEDVREQINEPHTEFTKVIDWSGAVVELEAHRRKSLYPDLDLDMVPYTMSKATLDSVVGEPEFVIEQMENEDSKRKLHSLNPGKAANLTYPKFSGADIEDFFNFKKEIENCFKGNRVRKEDQVTVLKKELKGEAFKLLLSQRS